MIQNLLTALGVAALSIQTPNNNTHEEPKRAYYDSSAVAEYGTDASTFYNYTENRIRIGAVGTADNVTSNQSGTWAASQDFGSSLLINLYTLSNNGDYPPVSDYDLYVNGTYQTTITNYSENTLYNISFVVPNMASTDYIWLFDHKEPSMSQTIIETAGDATTAAAAVVGAGFTGVISLFYNDGITGLGILSLILVGVSLVWFAFALVIRLWRRR